MGVLGSPSRRSLVGKCVGSTLWSARKLRQPITSWNSLTFGKTTSGSGAAISVQEFLDLLHPEEEIDILTGMVAKFHGIEVQHAVDLAAALRDIQKKKLQLNPEDVTSC